MKSEVINLTSEYTYIRCDDEFSMAFTNGQSISMWRGFYCFRTSQLQEYNTNNQLIITTNDGSSLWWLCTNTLIMSVTDINNEALGAIGQLVGQIGVVEQATSQIILENQLTALNALDYQQRSTNLLESLQNSFSIFLNAYVAANNVTDFGYITGTINNQFNVDVFIAKSNKYTFNCGVTFSYNGSVTGSGSCGSAMESDKEIVIGSLSTKLFNIVLDNVSAPGGALYCKLNFRRVASLKNNTVSFRLFDNENVQQTGFSVSNVSATASFSAVGKFIEALYFQNGSVNYSSHQVYPRNDVDISFVPVLTCTYLGGVFTLGMNNVVNSYSDLSCKHNEKAFDRSYYSSDDAKNFVWNIPSSTFSESLSINFDVAKT